MFYNWKAKYGGLTVSEAVLMTFETDSKILISVII